MKYLGLTIACLLCVLVFNHSAYGCSGGKINGEYHTSCYPWVGGDGYISATSQPNDTPRLLRMITDGYYGGTLIFDEENYFINDELPLLSYQTLEGTGRGVSAPAPLPSPMPSPTPTPALYHHTSKIIQMANDKSIFKITGGARSIAIRDMTLTRGANATGTIGVLMEDDSAALAALYIQLSNLNFNGFKKGIYVNAKDAPGGEDETGYWQCDNIRLDHSAFEHCDIGIHINSSNSGWNMTSLEFFVPGGKSADEADPLASNRKYGIFLEKSAYTTIDMAIGNAAGDGGQATAFIYVKEHGNLSIRNMIDEGFQNSVYIQGGDLSVPIHLMNNFYQSPLVVSNSTVVSTANQFNIAGVEPAIAKGASHIYSYGDKFCFETGSPCDYQGYTLNDSARIISSADQTQATSTVPNFISFDTESNVLGLSILSPASSIDDAYFLRLKQGIFGYDVSRNHVSGHLTFKGSQDDYSGYSFETNNGGKVVINNDGSVTYGSVTYTNLWSAAPNGTVVYCSNCTKTTSCASGGSGAIAQRINSAWYCD